MPDQTLRYHGSSRYAYGQALLALVAYARAHPEDFEVYPSSVVMLEHTGLSVSGPDLSGVSKVLDQVEGLTRQEPG